ncbi:poly(3-hydroxyalkanoate) depolymerase [Rivibacter subsaxonicus]|uniref:Poly(3-hydroxyalkanoate) depolymerase n=1 Tax=Rivibacter subsaxonicus TaxID=457575 RepID=A0A4Q7VFZ6_9BURK|nr:poly(3-hydroxyalkanoate) depolymerase [Rivibacter subsaxonicus]RZT94926.1 poly(3-hydroxyalkanoate) depolymerase [Rivibacter subsaxonicus]
MSSAKAAVQGKKAPVDRLQELRVDPASGLRIGTIRIGRQQLRVGIRPLPDGMEAAGPPLLMFNGIGANLELAGPLLSRLGAVEALIFDLPGAGQSPPPRLPYRLFSMARLACRLLDALGYEGRVDVMGVSWGGALAQQFAIQYPQRLRRLVLAATAIGPPAMIPGRPRVLLKMVNPQRYRDKGYMKRIAPELYGGDLRSRPEAIKLFTDHARAGHPTGYRYQMLAMLGWTSLPWLWRIRHPTLVLAGNDDPLVPLINARLHAWLLHDARLHVLDDGHLFLLTRAQQTADLISGFLAEPQRPRARTAA